MGGNNETIEENALASWRWRVVFISGCGARHSTKEVFYLVASNMALPYWQTAVAGIQESGERNTGDCQGCRARQLRPAGRVDRTAECGCGQAGGHSDLGRRRSVLAPGIDAAINAGIPVITIDSDAAGSQRLYFIGTNNLEAGRLGGHRVVEKLGGKGNVVFFTITGQPNTEERLKGFKDVSATRPGINIVDVIDIKGDAARHSTRPRN